jgi:glyoxylase-like metal-dependent hydrolase (beta-lactamase superfamily II)/ADP-ribose pyrophosphatase YjhB (NUDIX family)
MIRHAVSLVVSRRSRPQELLLVERSKKLHYFGGFWAFPGGTLDEGDGDFPIQGLVDDALAPFVGAGARELFEETGIWMGRGGSVPSPGALIEDRRRLLSKNVSFSNILACYRQHLDACDLEPLCRITTPPFSPVRFDTVFLRVLVPDETKVEVWDGELVGGDFVEPADTLRRWENGQFSVAPPMVLLLQEWSRGQDGLDKRVREATESYERGKLPRIHFSPGIIMAPLRSPTQPPATHTNTCIVGEARLYVVDPSPIDRHEQERLFELVSDLVAEGRKLGGILLTNYHLDHVGALEAMQKRFGVSALAHADCAAKLPRGKFGAHLKHRDEIDLGRAPDGSAAWSLRVFHVPGRARGQLAFQESRYGAIIVGSLVSTLSPVFVDPSDGHLATYLESLRFLETVSEGTLYPGLGPPSPDGRSVLWKALEHQKEREARVLAALSGEPQSLTELARRTCSDINPKLYQVTERTLLSGLIKLEEEGRAVKSEGGYRLAS